MSRRLYFLLVFTLFIISVVQSNNIHCDEGEDCNIDCIGSNSCQTATLLCPQNYKCVIKCMGNFACSNATINASLSSELIITGCTDNNACTFMDVYCPPHTQNTKKCTISGNDNIRNGVNYYAINGFADLKVINYTGDYSLNHIHIFCLEDYSHSCSVANNGFICDPNGDTSCNDATAAITTVFATTVFSTSFSETEKKNKDNILLGYNLIYGLNVLHVIITALVLLLLCIGFMLVFFIFKANHQGKLLKQRAREFAKIKTISIEPAAPQQNTPNEGQYPMMSPTFTPSITSFSPSAYKQALKPGNMSNSAISVSHNTSAKMCTTPQSTLPHHNAKLDHRSSAPPISNIGNSANLSIESARDHPNYSRSLKMRYHPTQTQRPHHPNHFPQAHSAKQYHNNRPQRASLPVHGPSNFVRPLSFKEPDRMHNAQKRVVNSEKQRNDSSESEDETIDASDARSTSSTTVSTSANSVSESSELSSASDSGKSLDDVSAANDVHPIKRISVRVAMQYLNEQKQLGVNGSNIAIDGGSALKLDTECRSPSETGVIGTPQTMVIHENMTPHSNVGRGNNDTPGTMVVHDLNENASDSSDSGAFTDAVSTATTATDIGSTHL